MSLYIKQTHRHIHHQHTKMISYLCEIYISSLTHTHTHITSLILDIQQILPSFPLNLDSNETKLSHANPSSEIKPVRISQTNLRHTAPRQCGWLSAADIMQHNVLLWFQALIITYITWAVWHVCSCVWLYFWHFCVKIDLLPFFFFFPSVSLLYIHFST